MKKKGYTIAWILWIIAFFVIEVPAATNEQEDDTLSEHFWWVSSIKKKLKGWRWRRIFGAAFLVWLVAHLTSGGWM